MITADSAEDRNIAIPIIWDLYQLTGILDRIDDIGYKPQGTMAHYPLDG